MQALFSFTKVTLLVAAAATVMMSCESTGRSQNRKIQEAKSIHLAAAARFDSVYSILEAKKAEIEDRMERTSPGDERLEAYQAMMRGLEKSTNLLDEWGDSVPGVPGLDDSVSKYFDPEGNMDLSKLSDEKILELQTSYSTRLNDVIQEVNGLLTTIDMYENE